MAEFEKLGEFLKKHRVEAGLTQAEVGAALGGIHNQFVSNWERGLCAPPGHSLHTLIKLFKIDREKLTDVMLEDARTAIGNKVYSKKTR